jgi:hypothetical protein
MGLSICSSNDNKYYAVDNNDDYIKYVLEIKNSGAKKYLFDTGTIISFENLN